MIRFDRVSVQYVGAPAPTLVDVDLTVAEGEFALVAGRTGVGKSTLLGAVNGHVPHFTGGQLSGRVTVAGQDTRDHPPRELAHLVGVVGQDPLAGFVTDTVEEELAYGLEQLGVKPSAMRQRVEETLDLLGIAPLRARPLRALSGGQQQRVAIGAVLASGARVLVLDEPTSALDPSSAEEVLAALLRLVHDLGATVMIAEHRLERVIEYADRMILLTGGGRVVDGRPEAVITASPIAPPVVELGRLAGWSPLPLSVRDARRQAAPLRSRLADLDPAAYPRTPAAPTAPEAPDAANAAGRPVETAETATPVAAPPAAASDPNAPDPPARTGSTPAPAPDTAGGLAGRSLSVVYGRVRAVRDVDFDLAAGSITALMGRNGSGKSSLLWAVTGVGTRHSGTWSVGGQDLTGAPVATTRRFVRLVPQTAAALLYLDSVAAECAAADADAHQPPGACRAILDALAPGIDPAQHPRDLSEGQKLCLVVALQLTAEAPVLLLDEPTRGLDYPAKAVLGRNLRRLAGQGRAICLSTHDVEFAASVADRVAVMATGEIIAEGPAQEVLSTSALFAPQTAKVLSPAPWLTVPQVAAALAAERTP
ncbi:MAG: ATP-binding cassette domain-containing protein [Propionibacteriaceae bacterium]|nr:ATP-binding cassette domain-containing protein [Propionibacteriaceae bacterium]